MRSKRALPQHPREAHSPSSRRADYDKQAAIDLFLGIKPPLPPPAMWEYIPPPPRPSYRDWYTPSHLANPHASPEHVARCLQATIDEEDAQDPLDLWRRFYRGVHYESLAPQFAFKMSSTLKGPVLIRCAGLGLCFTRMLATLTR